MKNILEKFDLDELTQDDLDDVIMDMALCNNIDEKCKNLFDKYNRIFDMVGRYINGIKVNPTK